MTDYTLGHGDVVVAAITSCTNTSNPSVMLAAGLVARNAAEKGPEGEAVGQNLARPRQPGRHRLLQMRQGLQADLDALGFNLVGYGCTTCIGNTGPLPDAIGAAITENNLVVGAVLSGNRNFEARIHQDVRANYLASPPLVVAYAIAGSMMVDITKEPSGHRQRRPAGLSARHLAVQPGNFGRRRQRP